MKEDTVIAKQMARLRAGDGVRWSREETAFHVADHYGKRVTVVSTVDISNPHEWTVGNGPLVGIGELVPGSVVRNLGSGRKYVVTSVHPESLGGHATGVRTREITEDNLAEWEVA